MSSRRPFLPKKQNIELSYMQAMSSGSGCQKEASDTFQYRSKQKVPFSQNVATITLKFLDGQAITMTAQSVPITILSTTNETYYTPNGHSERWALVLAINEAIEKEISNATDLSPLQGEDPTKSLQHQKENLQTFLRGSISEIIVYTERIPCAGLNKNLKSSAYSSDYVPCDEFFADFFQGLNYKFYYSVPLSDPRIMEKTLEKQIKEVNNDLARQQTQPLPFSDTQVQDLLSPQAATEHSRLLGEKNNLEIIIDKRQKTLRRIREEPGITEEKINASSADTKSRLAQNIKSLETVNAKLEKYEFTPVVSSRPLVSPSAPSRPLIPLMISSGSLLPPRALSGSSALSTAPSTISSEQALSLSLLQQEYENSQISTTGNTLTFRDITSENLILEEKGEIEEQSSKRKGSSLNPEQDPDSKKHKPSSA